jgi:hypothetical protein
MPAARCKKPWVRPDGTTTVLLGCCRLAGHTGECHGHFSGRLGRFAHVTIHRANGLPIRCSEGTTLDGEQPT